MSAEFVRCESCKAEIPSGRCEFATYNTVVDGKKYVFCCEQCALRFKQKTKRKK